VVYHWYSVPLCTLKNPLLPTAAILEVELSVGPGAKSRRIWVDSRVPAVVQISRPERRLERAWIELKYVPVSGLVAMKSILPLPKLVKAKGSDERRPG